MLAQADLDEQPFFVQPSPPPPRLLYKGAREQHAVTFVLDPGSICLSLQHNADQMFLVANYIHLWSPTTVTCAFMPGCLTSHIWLPTPDCIFA